MGAVAVDQSVDMEELIVFALCILVGELLFVVVVDTVVVGHYLIHFAELVEVGRFLGSFRTGDLFGISVKKALLNCC